MSEADGRACTGRPGPLVVVETIVQSADGLARQVLRVPIGATIADALRQAGHAEAIAAIAAGHLGLGRFGQRAWLDDPVATATADGRPDGTARIEVMLPISADAKAQRRARAAAADNARPRSKGRSRQRVRQGAQPV